MRIAIRVPDGIVIWRGAGSGATCGTGTGAGIEGCGGTTTGAGAADACSFGASGGSGADRTGRCAAFVRGFGAGAGSWAAGVFFGSSTSCFSGGAVALDRLSAVASG